MIPLNSLETLILRHLSDSEKIPNPFGDGQNLTPMQVATRMKLQPEHFTNQKFRTVYAAMIDLASSSRPINSINVFELVGSEIISDPEVIDLFDYHPNTLNLVVNIKELYKSVWVERTKKYLTHFSGLLETWTPYKPIDPIKLALIEMTPPPDFIKETPLSTDAGLMKLWADDMKSGIESGGLQKISTGITNLDSVIGGGVMTGKMITIAALPGSGKTALMTNICLSMARSIIPVLYITNEMSKLEILDRMVAAKSGVCLNAISARKLDAEQRDKLIDAYREFKTMPIVIDDTTRASWELTEASIRRFVKEKAVKVIFLDYLQQFRFTQKQYQSRTQELTEITARIKNMCMENDITIVVASQLNRSIYNRDNKKPVLGDLKESGSIEQDSDVVAFLSKIRETSRFEKPISVIRVNVEKNRLGSVCEFETEADLSINKFYRGE